MATIVVFCLIVVVLPCAFAPAGVVRLRRRIERHPRMLCIAAAIRRLDETSVKPGVISAERALESDDPI
jgi:hypothetical protein